jgi:hypothetical protein
MDMIERVDANRPYIRQGMCKASLRPVYETNQRGIGTDMNNTAEHGKVRLPVSVHCANQVSRFEPRKAIHKIGPVQPFPGFNSRGGYHLHALLTL